MVGGRHAKEARSRKRIRAARVCPARALRRRRAACPALALQSRHGRAAPAAALRPIAAGGGGAPHAYANPQKHLLTRSRLLMFLHLIHSLMLISFENVNYLFNMNLLNKRACTGRLALAVTFAVLTIRFMQSAKSSPKRGDGDDADFMFFRVFQRSLRSKNSVIN